jgi:hypothetical protein
MGPVVEKWLIEATKTVYSDIDKPLREIYTRSRDVAVRCIPYLNPQEAAYLAQACTDLARKCKARRRIKPDEDLAVLMARPFMIKPMEHAANVMDKRLQTKAKAAILEGQFGYNRPHAVIFYLCSWHQKPAEGHKNLQGKIYVDRFWRQTLKDAGEEYLIPAVQNMIRARSMLTVQEATQDPYWLIYRPYCRHYFVPVPTDEVMGSVSDREVLMNHPEARMHVHRSMDDQTRRDKYIRRRATISGKLQKIRDRKKTP